MYANKSIWTAPKNAGSEGVGVNAKFHHEKPKVVMDAIDEEENEETKM